MRSETTLPIKFLEERAQLSWVYESKLNQIARLSKRIMRRPTLMGSDDIDDLVRINDIAGGK